MSDDQMLRINFNNVFFAEWLLVDELLRLFATRSELAVYLALYRHTHGISRVECEAGYSYLGKMCGLHVNAVKTATFALRKRGFIRLMEQWKPGMAGSRYAVYNAKQILGGEHLKPEHWSQDEVSI